MRPGLGKAYGHILAEAVERVIEGQMKPVTGPLRVSFAEAQLPFEKLPVRKELRSLLPSPDGNITRAVKVQLALLKYGDRRPLLLRYLIHFWQFGSDLKLISLSSETVADYALRFKQAHGCDDTWGSGYNDDYWCCIPSRHVWNEGGYEGLTGMLECDLPGPFTPAVEEIIAAKVDELVEETNGQLRSYPRPSKHA